MAFGLGVLRLQPSAFWAMTPLELRAAARGLGASGFGGGSGEPPSRAGLAALMQAFPDAQGDHHG